MSLPQIVPRDEWLNARKALLVKEKELTRARDALNAERRRLPMVSGCPSCTAGADEISPGLIDHLHSRDTTMVVVSRAPLAKIESYKARRGWTFPWCSSCGSDFNYDFNVTLDESVAAPARAASCATATASSTPTRLTPVAPRWSAARTTTST